MALKQGILLTLFSTTPQSECSTALKNGITVLLYSPTPQSQSEHSIALENGITASFYSPILHGMALKQESPYRYVTQHLKVNIVWHYSRELLYRDLACDLKVNTGNKKSNITG